MKTILFSIILAFAANAAEITLTDSGQIIKDGVSLNNAGDALLNGAITVAQFQTALKAKLDTQAAAVTEATAAKVLAESKLATLIAGARTAMEKPTTNERLAAAASLIQAAEQTAAEAKAEALRKEIAAKEAELQKLVE
jgi:hypothetical protein